MLLRRSATVLVVVAGALGGLSGPARAESAGSAARPYQAGLIAAGDTHTCAVTVDHTVSCWGSDTYGELGSFVFATSSAEPVVVPGISTAVAVAAGSHFSCALLAEGTVTCWGENNAGQSGGHVGADATSGTPPHGVPGISAAVAITAGGADACALLADHTIRCWGDNTAGQLGSPVNISADVTKPGPPNPDPLPVPGIDDAVAISTSGTHSCAVLADHTLRCWGFLLFDALGATVPAAVSAAYGTQYSPVPLPVDDIAGAVAVTTGGFYTCALLGDGTVRCWGNSNVGQLGPPDPGGVLSAQGKVTVPDVTSAVAITAGNEHTCAVLADGSAKCWGLNQFGELGSRTETAGGPGRVTGLPLTTAMSAHGNHTCALVVDGTVRCWGENSSGELGRLPGVGGTGPNPDPVTVPLRSVAGLLSDLSLTASAAATSLVGHTVTVRLDLHNGGPDAVVPSVWVQHETGLPVVAPAPAGLTSSGGVDTWVPGIVPSGADAVLTLTLRADQPGLHTLSAQVGTSSSADPDSIPGDNRPGEDDQVSIPIDVTAAPVSFTMTVAHSGRQITATATALFTTVAPADACTGTVSFAIKRGATTTTKNATLSLSHSGSCSATVHYKAAKRGSYLIGASHGATTYVSASKTPTRTVKVS